MHALQFHGRQLNYQKHALSKKKSDLKLAECSKIDMILCLNGQMSLDKLKINQRSYYSHLTQDSEADFLWNNPKKH